MSTIALRSHDRVTIDRWPTEIPLFVLSILVSIPLWILLAVSMIGLAYAVAIGLFLFVSHVTFVAYVRGNAVRLGPDQLPDLYGGVKRLSAQIGLEKIPEAYVMEAGGALNALATRFLRSNMIILYSDLLDACGDDQEARDMIVGHELGHLKAGHLRWRWLTLPSLLVPFLGSTLSRAREYTCDRYGAALAGNTDGALLGLTILGAGAKHGRMVNRQAFARQQAYLDTGWMTLGVWLSSHPPLAKRLSALDSRIAISPSAAGPLRALGILFTSVAIVVALAFAGIQLASYFQDLTGRTLGAAATAPAAADHTVGDSASDAKARNDLRRLASLIELHRQAGGEIPADDDGLYALWSQAYPGEPAPVDPFDGTRYGYIARDGGYLLFSSGPDGEGATDDDIDLDSEAASRREEKDPS